MRNLIRALLILVALALPEAAAAALNRGVERLAREFPAHYQWTYRRFQLPGDKRPSPYARPSP